MMWKKFNNNPLGKSTGDCVIRAISRALGKSWEETYLDLCLQGYHMADWGSSNPVWDAYLRNHGFVRKSLPNTCPDCYTIQDFVNEHEKGIYIVATGTHVVTIIDGTIFDSWDSSQEIPTYYYQKE